MPQASAGATVASSSQITDEIITSADIKNDEIKNEDIKSDAAIPRSKLSGVAASGANSDITSLAGLSTPLSVAQGGTGAATLGDAGVLIGNGTGAVAVTGAGTAGQALISNGPGVDPTFQDTGAPAGLTLISTSTPGAVTLIDFTSIPQTYRSLILEFTGLSNTVATRGITVEVDTGLGLGNAGNCATWKQISNVTTTAIGPTARVLWTTVTHTAAQATHGRLEFHGYQSGPIKGYSGLVGLGQNLTNWDAPTTTTWVNGVLTDASGVWRTGAIVGIRVTWDNVATGVFDGGTINLYGVK